jgi:hypothetical protein
MSKGFTIAELLIAIIFLVILAFVLGFCALAGMSVYKGCEYVTSGNAAADASSIVHTQDGQTDGARHGR